MKLVEMPESRCLRGKNAIDIGRHRPLDILSLLLGPDKDAQRSGGTFVALTQDNQYLYGGRNFAREIAWNARPYYVDELVWH